MGAANFIQTARSLSGRCAGEFSRLSSLVLAVILFGISYFPSSGTEVENTARADYNVEKDSRNSFSNTVRTVLTRASTPASIVTCRYSPNTLDSYTYLVPATSYAIDGANEFAPLPPPRDSGVVIDLSPPVSLTTTNIFRAGQPIFLTVTDLDQNQDPQVRETVLVTVAIESIGEREVLLLTETETDMGVFIGYIHTSAENPIQYNGKISATNQADAIVSYHDSIEDVDLAASITFVDPFGTVFDSATGQPVNGVTIDLVNTDSGMAATVFGDDGVSGYPATVVSGGTAIDASGAVYTFGPGGYRFPLIPEGNYKFLLTPPAGYSAPSIIPTSQLQILPGAPFAIMGGSREEEFVVATGPPVQIDIPVDPPESGLFIGKSVARDTIGIGEFLRYDLSIENSGAVPITAVQVTDVLPVGFRYQNGSTYLQGTPLDDPQITSDGGTLTFMVGNLAVGESIDLRYVVEVAAGAQPGNAVNTAVATGAAGERSNVATASVFVRDDLQWKNLPYGEGRCSGR